MRALLLSVAVVFLAVDGYVHGLWTNRWQTSHELKDAAARLHAVPLEIEGWQGKDGTLRQRDVEVAQFTEYLLRHYVRKDGQIVDVLLACGPPGPLSVHTPEACFGGAGFDLRQAPIEEVFKPSKASPDARFWMAKYEKPQAIPPLTLRVLWSWHADDGWQAPANPRLTFAGQPFLYKLYVTRSLRGTKETGDVCAEFMKVFLPALDKSLFAAP